MQDLPGLKTSTYCLLDSCARSKSSYCLPAILLQAMVPLLATDKDKTTVVMEQVAFVLPSRMLHECQKRGRMSRDVYGASGFSSLYEYWSQEDQNWIITQGFPTPWPQPSHSTSTKMVCRRFVKRATAFGAGFSAACENISIPARIVVLVLVPGAL